MKIKSLQLKNFKRFTDLTLQGIPENAKLVLLIGSNGSGKSSVFDAFEAINKTQNSFDPKKDFSFYDEPQRSYYHKKKDQIFEINFIADNSPKEQFVRTNSSDLSYTGNSFFGRSAVRYLPRLTKRVIGSPIDIKEDSDRPQYYIDTDNRFENDIDLLLTDIVKKVFSDLNQRTDGKIDEVKAFRQKINDSLSRIFKSSNYSQLSLINFETPSDGNPAQLIFRKGDVEMHYDFLSSGEKEIINLLINLYTRTRYFDNTIYFMDEIDAHLNTQLQYELLKEITENWIPDNCQFWTASHSLGFIQYAKENNDAVIFDFDDLDFDYPKILLPETKDNADIYNIAVSKELLPQLFKGYKIIFVENEDKKYYASLNIDHTLFVPEKNRDGVFHKSKAGEFRGLVDRDFLTDDDIVLIEQQYTNLRILRYYCVENYLFHPDNLEEYYLKEEKDFDKDNYINKVFSQKEIVKPELLIKIASIRQGYPYFKEVGMEKSEGRKRFIPENENYIQSQAIAGYLNSNNFEDYYKVFSMKDNCKGLSERQNINPIDLAKTNWFKNQIENIIK